MVVSFLILIATGQVDFEARDLLFLAQPLTILIMWSLLKRNSGFVSPTIVVFLVPLFIGINKNLFVRGMLTSTEQDLIE
jgi:hypothetical protein